ncbi:MAG: DoxX family protein [Parachlamydia sp.]|jgi:uncharacterized membrane protein YphA (DoxX/SURF4 family)|nr:DoxX family protein [Parachlamydia sp.]
METSLILIFIGSTLALAAALWFFWKKREERDFLLGPKDLGASANHLTLFYGWVPVIIGIHTAIALLINGVQGYLFFSELPLKGSYANWIGLIEIFCALSLFYGGFTRPSAAIIGFLWAFGIDYFGFIPMLASLQYLGVAGFFYLAGRGPYAVDRLLFPDLEPSISYTGYALLFLRVCVGLNLMVFAFTENFAHLSPTGEQASVIHFIPPLAYAYLLGSLKFLAGLLIAIGVFPRTVILLTLICINASLTIYRWNEIIDYLPLNGILAVLFICEPQDPRQQINWVEGMRKDLPEEKA